MWTWAEVRLGWLGLCLGFGIGFGFLSGDTGDLRCVFMMILFCILHLAFRTEHFCFSPARELGFVFIFISRAGCVQCVD